MPMPTRRQGDRSMATVRYPGVFVEEMDPLSRPIAGVSTSTAGFIGLASDDTPMPEKPGAPKSDFSGFDAELGKGTAPAWTNTGKNKVVIGKSGDGSLALRIIDS